MASQPSDEIIQFKRISFQEPGDWAGGQEENTMCFLTLYEKWGSVPCCWFLLVSEFSPDGSCGHLLDEAARRGEGVWREASLGFL